MALLLPCITGYHFEVVCLNHVICKLAYFQYRQKHGTSYSSITLNDFLQNNIKILPTSFYHFLQGNTPASLTVSKKRRGGGWIEILRLYFLCREDNYRCTVFPSHNYTGLSFQYTITCRLIKTVLKI